MGAAAWRIRVRSTPEISFQTKCGRGIDMRIDVLCMYMVYMAYYCTLWVLANRRGEVRTVPASILIVPAGTTVAG